MFVWLLSLIGVCQYSATWLWMSLPHKVYMNLWARFHLFKTVLTYHCDMWCSQNDVFYETSINIYLSCYIKLTWAILCTVYTFTFDTFIHYANNTTVLFFQHCIQHVTSQFVSNAFMWKDSKARRKATVARTVFFLNCSLLFGRQIWILLWSCDSSLCVGGDDFW